MKKIINLDIIDLVHTDEELQTQDNEITKNMMQRFLKNVADFLDDEEKLGFLSQKNADKVVAVEDMLREELQKAKQHTEQKEQKEATLTTTYTFFDNDDGGMDCELFMHKISKNDELEL